jgi:uncharacterized membrane protein
MVSLNIELAQAEIIAAPQPEAQGNSRRFYICNAKDGYTNKNICVREGWWEIKEVLQDLHQENSWPT